MMRLKKWVNGLSIKRKIIYYSYLVIIPIMLLICSIYIVRNYEAIRVTRDENNQSSIQSLSASISLVMTDVNNLSTYIAINQEINAILTSDNPEVLNQDTKLWLNQAPMQIVEDMMALKGYIKTVAIYPENGVKPYLRCTDVSAYVPELELINQTNSYKDAVDKRGKSTWIQVAKGGTDIYLANRTEKLVIYREIYDLTKTKPLAYMVLGIPVEHVRKLCDNVIQSSEEGIIVYNSEGKELLCAGNIDLATKEELELSKDFDCDWKSRKTIIEIGNYVIYTYQASKTSPVICKMVPQSRMLDMMGETVYMPFALLVGVLLGLLPVLIFVSNVVSKPLQRVCDAMGKFKQGDFEQQVEVETGDEVGEVAACFNKMVVDIKSLIEHNYVMALKEKESELATLQAQINPHFLYNTLDALYWQACNAGNEEIADNIYALSQLFRLVLGQGKGIVTIEAETELVRRYLEIQKMKFGRKLDYEIQIEESLNSKLIPKLILQPFVENAVVHGIGNSKDNCKIEVSGKIENEKVKFVIRDTGIGMTRKQIEEIWEKQPKTHRSGQRIGGYAVHNVRERLELKYGEDFTLEIRSEEGNGTEILLVIPIEENVDDKEA